MHWLLILEKYAPSIISVIKLVAQNMPESDGKTRLNAAVAILMAGEGIAQGDASGVPTAIHAMHAALKIAGKLPPALPTSGAESGGALNVATGG